MIAYVSRIHTTCHDPMPEHGLLVIHSASLSLYHIWLKQYRLWTYIVGYQFCQQCHHVRRYFSFRCPVLLTWMAGDKWLTQLVQRCFLAHRSFRCCVPWQMKEWMTEYDGWTKITTDYFFLQGLVDHLAPTIDCFLSRIVVVKMCGSKLISLRLLQPILGKMKTIPGELA